MAPRFDFGSSCRSAAPNSQIVTEKTKKRKLTQHDQNTNNERNNKISGRRDNSRRQDFNVTVFAPERGRADAEILLRVVQVFAGTSILTWHLFDAFVYVYAVGLICNLARPFRTSA